MSQDVLIRPIVTEKMTRLMEEGGQYAFEVRRDANKIEIRRAVESHYPGVKVDEVRTMIVRGKRRTQQTRRGITVGRKATIKKAIVTLKEGEIDFFEQV
jgi:large subunit ribosomal protein L23